MRIKMKNKILLIALFIVLFILSSAIYAQSDYEIVQSFKQKYSQIEKDIKNPQSLEDLDSIYVSINSLKKEYASHRDLLDKSLYPDDFNKSFDKLMNAYNVKRNDFMQINVLQTQVISLQQQLDSLNQHNADLLNRVKVLEVQSKSDKSRLAQLEKTIGELKVSLQKRDEIVMSMVDSLLSQPNIGNALNPREQQQIYNKLGENNVLYNINRLLSDNIRFIQMTKLYPEDVDDIKNQQDNFAKMWRNIGPRMVEIYSGKSDANYLKVIDESFTKWTDALEQGVWNSINSEFAKYNINLGKFSSGIDFTRIVTSFINDEIKNAGVKSRDASILTYKDFADSAWYGDIKPVWVSNLIDYKMMTEVQKDTIEKKISEWKEKVSPSKVDYLFIIIAVIIIAIIVIFFFRKYFGSNPEIESSEE